MSEPTTSTANAFAKDINSCLESGMNACLTKPIEAQVLLTKIQQIVSQTKGEDINTLT